MTTIFDYTRFTMASTWYAVAPEFYVTKKGNSNAKKIYARMYVIREVGSIQRDLFRFSQ